MKTYYIVEANDGCQIGIEQATLKAARQELKEIIKEDRAEGLEDGDIEYYITKGTPKRTTRYHIKEYKTLEGIKWT